MVTVDLGAKISSPLSAAHSKTLGVGCEGAGCCWDMIAGVAICEIIGVGLGKFRGYGVCGDIKVEGDRGDTGALWDSCAGVSIGGSGVSVSAAGHPPSEVCGQSAYCVMWECCL